MPPGAENGLHQGAFLLVSGKSQGSERTIGQGTLLTRGEALSCDCLRKPAAMCRPITFAGRTAGRGGVICGRAGSFPGKARERADTGPMEGFPRGGGSKTGPEFTVWRAFLGMNSLRPAWAYASGGVGRNPVLSRRPFPVSAGIPLVHILKPGRAFLRPAPVAEKDQSSRSPVPS